MYECKQHVTLTLYSDLSFFHTFDLLIPNYNYLSFSVAVLDNRTRITSLKRKSCGTSFNKLCVETTEEPAIQERKYKFISINKVNRFASLNCLL